MNSMMAKPPQVTTPQPNVLRFVPKPGEWREASYPGDNVLSINLTREGEHGSIRVQWYRDDVLMVGSYTPGYETCFPGDTPKFHPDRYEWCEDKVAATTVFVRYLIAAFRVGWRPRQSN